MNISSSLPTPSCGIPRIRVLGTKQDWITLEQKLQQLYSQVFNDTRCIVEYLERTEKMVHDIYTRRDPTFWKKFFSIGRCTSGHNSDVVEGWIVRMYKNCKGNKKQGEIEWEGTSFYQHISSISTVKYKNFETNKTFALHTGI